MKNFEKIVPVLASGLVVAGLGTADAFAMDNVDTQSLPGASEVETPKAPESPSTDINSATQVGDTETDPDTGADVSNKTVNFDVGTDNDGITNDGDITVTERTEDPEIVESDPRPSGNPVVTPNPGGGSTSTTPTEVDVTTTENSEIDIEGNVNPQNPVVTEPSETEKNEITNNLNTNGLQNLDLETVELDNESAGTTATQVGDFKAVDKSTETNPYTEGDRTGNKTTTTVTFEKVVEGEATDKALTSSELGVILGTDNLTAVEGAEKPTYTYTKADGTKVTVVVESDTSKETLTTTYRVKVSQTTTTLNGESKTYEDIVDGTIYDDNDNSSAKADEVISNLLKDVETNKDKYTVSQNKSEDGKTTTTIRCDGESPKEYIITETETPLAEAPTKDVLLKWLGNDFELSEKGEIVTKNGGYEVSVTTDKLTGKTIVRTIQVYDVAETDTVVVVDKDGNVVKDKDGNAITVDKATSEAVQKAVVEAVEKALAEDGINKATFNAEYDKKGNIWTVTATVDVDGVKKVYTYTVTSSSNKDNPDVVDWTTEKLVEKDVASGSTTTVTGSAWVSGETVVWTENINKDGEALVTGSGTVNIVNGKLNGETVDETAGRDLTDGKGNVTGKVVVTRTENPDGTITIKTYTFTFNDVITDADKATLNLKAGQAVTNYDSLKKTSWFVEKQTETPAGPATDWIGSESIGDAGEVEVTVVNENTVKVKEGDKTITLTKGPDGKYHNTDTTDTAVYEITEVDANVSIDTIETALKAKYNNTLSINRETGVATYTDDDGRTVTVTYNTTKKYTVTKVENAEVGTDAKTSLEDLIDELKKIVLSAGQGETYYANGKALSVDEHGNLLIQESDIKKTTITTENVIQWIDPNTAINFEAMGDAGLVDYLENAKKNDTVSDRSVGHLELVVSGTLNHEDETGITDEDKHCIIVPDSTLKVEVAQTAKELVYAGQTVDGVTYGPTKVVHLDDEITYDYQKGGFIQIDRDGHHQNLGSNANNGQGTKRDPGYYTYQYYKVTGTIAYGSYTTISWSEYYNENYSGAIAVAVPIKNTNKTEYRVYQKTATLETYGYLGEKSNACGWQSNIMEDRKHYGYNQYRGYDLKLGDLTLLKDGQTVTASGEEVTNYSVDLVKKTTTSQSSDASLEVTALAKDKVTSDKEKVGNGSLLTGNYQITQTKAETELKDSAGKWMHTGTDNFSYDTYKNWVEAENGKSTSNSSQYNGSLGYEYSIPEKVTVGDVNIDVDNASKEVKATRTVAAKLSSTSVSTSTKPGDPIVVVTPPSDNGGGGDNRTPTTPTPPVVDIPEEEPPLVDIPEEEPPLVDVPEEEPPLVDVPEEEPPLVDIPETQPPTVTIPAQKVPLVKAPTPNTVEILEEEVPLADVPETGESPMGLLAAAAACFSALGLGLLKKKRED